MVESSLGIVGACLPLLRPIFTDQGAKGIFTSLWNMLSRSSSSSLSDSANVEGMKYAKMENGGISHKLLGTQKVENVEMV